MNKILCKYAINKSTSVRINVICSITKDKCGMVRYCPTNNSPVSSDQYIRYGCKLENKQI
jgi:hypothetical protein